MDRTFEANALVNTPPALPSSPSSGYPTAGNANAGLPPTVPGAWWFYMVTEELRAAIASAGLAPDHQNIKQLAQALAALQRQQTHVAYSTSGSAPSFLVNVSNLNALAAPLRLRVQFHAAGVGADTLNLNDLGAKSVVSYNHAGLKVAAAIAPGRPTDVEFDGTDWVVLNPLPELPPGSIHYFAGPSAPAGYLKANGAAVSRSTYAALFAAIGTTFGAGNGSSTFNVPDLRGEFLRGWDDGRGVDAGRLFGSPQKGTMNVFDDLQGGYSVYALQGNTSGNPNSNAGLDNVTAGYTASNYPGLSLAYSAGTTNGYTMSSWLSLGSVGGGMTRPRNVALLACIKH